ncbi:methylamine dehydrogenase light chain, partial [Novosphingobium sp. KN65.2]|uniref:methylamine dehydrogenase light chain n=1 Tax=Novosphingobium sp. KN65.2 TaxID=1478134 RepID=UPI0026F42059
MTMSGIDKLTETLSRRLAKGTSRRSSLAWLGGLVTGTAALPLLPVARAATPHGGGTGRPPITSGTPQDPGDRASCDYWRYCAIDGFLCSCCGGTVCPSSRH